MAGSTRRRAHARGKRLEGLNRIAPLALAAGVLVVTLLIAYSLLVRPPNVGPPPAPSTTATPLAVPGAPGDMLAGRYEHTATLLADGRVLVAGGTDSNNNTLASAELFDPETGSWSPTGNMLTPLTDHTATLLRDGRGGRCRPYALRALRPGQRFVERDRARPVTQHRDAPGRRPVLVTTSDAQAQLYDPADGSWSPTAPVLKQTYNHSATLLADGSVLKVGGDVVPDVGQRSAEVYDPAPFLDRDRRLRTAADPPADPAPRRKGAGRGLGLRGRAVRGLYDPDSRTWSSIEITVPLPDDAAALFPDGRVLFVGSDGSSALYDSANASWAIGPPMVEGRDGASLTLLTDGTVLVAGGVEGRLVGVERPTGVFLPALSSSERFDPVAGD